MAAHSGRSDVAETVLITTEDLEPAVRLRAGFENAGYRVELLTAGEQLSDALGEPVLIVLTGGLRERRARLLTAAAAEHGPLPAIGLLESTELPSREVCRELGLTECFTKPVDIDEVVLVGKRLVGRERLREITGIVGETEAMDEVLERVVRIAEVDSTVLIQGESGTGKELVARGIHALSRRRHRPFIAVNVAALNENLLESELFGHEKGAFTGASSLRKGLFELAHSGTIFLDEIGEMPAATQTKLLRVLEEREFRRVGGEEVLRVDVRVLAATNRDLREQVELGGFRRDLYHRLNVLRIELPALRQRRPDIPRLVETFVRRFSREHDRPFLGIDPEAMRLLVEYDWPGNVRELRNLVESMVVLALGRVIRPEDIPSEVRRARTPTLLPALMRQPPSGGATPAPEMEFILRTLFDLKIDMEELRREFESRRHLQRGNGGNPGAAADRAFPFPPAAESLRSLPPPRGTALPESDPAAIEHLAAEPAPASGTVVFRPGMTMEELERSAIGVALRTVRGNRRKAAEMLGIGERTLYRKIKEYGISE